MSRTNKGEDKLMLSSSSEPPAAIHLAGHVAPYKTPQSEYVSMVTTGIRYLFFFRLQQYLLVGHKEHLCTIQRQKVSYYASNAILHTRKITLYPTLQSTLQNRPCSNPCWMVISPLQSQHSHASHPRRLRAVANSSVLTNSAAYVT